MGCCCSDLHSAVAVKDQEAKMSDPTYFKNKQGLWLRTRTWLPADGIAARGVIVLVHGFGEHVDRHNGIATILAQNGFAVVGYDHQGHGKSDGDRAYVVRFSDYVDDLEQFADTIVEKHVPQIYMTLPKFLMGHSMGGQISSLQLLRNQARWKAVILSAPANSVDPKVATPTLKRLAAIMATMAPKLELDKLDNKLISRDPDVVKEYGTDPLVYHGGVRSRMGHEMLQAMDFFWANVSKVTVPILIVHGTDDKIVPLDGSVRFIKEASSACKTLKTYEGYYHELFVEPGKEAVIADVLAFLDEQCKNTPYP